MKQFSSLHSLSVAVLSILLFMSCSDENEILPADPLAEEITTRSLPVITIECVDAYVEVGGYVSYKGTYCYVVGGSPGGSPGGGGGSGNSPDIPYPTTPPYAPGGYPTNTGGGGGGSFNDGTNWYFPYNYLQVNTIYSAKSTLNLLEKEKLIDIIELIKTVATAEAKALYNYMLENGLQIEFAMNPNQKGLAQYNTETKKITFKNIGEITVYNLLEELVHAVQDQRFYSNVMNRKYKNYEFEAKVFRDLVSAFCYADPNCSLPMPQYSATFYDGCTPAFQKEYGDWLKGIVSKGYIDGYSFSVFNDICGRWGGDSGSNLSGFIPEVLRFFMGHIKPPKPPQ